MKKIIVYALLVFSFLSSPMVYPLGSSVSKNNIVISVKPFGKITKYTAAGLCALYGVKGMKKSIESAKLLLPIGADFNLMDLLMFPFRLLIFPFRAIGVAKCFLVAGSFGSLTYFLHKIGC